MDTAVLHCTCMSYIMDIWFQNKKVMQRQIVEGLKRVFEEILAAQCIEKLNKRVSRPKKW
jgi:hypothetical protein